MSHMEMKVINLVSAAVIFIPHLSIRGFTVSLRDTIHIPLVCLTVRWSRGDVSVGMQKCAENPGLGFGCSRKRIIINKCICQLLIQSDLTSAGAFPSTYARVAWNMCTYTHVVVVLIDHFTFTFTNTTVSHSFLHYLLFFYILFI